MVLVRFWNGHITGRVYSVQTPKNLSKRYFLEKTQYSSSKYLFQQFLGTKSQSTEPFLDEYLFFKCHVDKVLTKASKGIAAIKRLRSFFPHKSIITIYKAIIRPHLDYADILYDRPKKATFYQKIESA